MKTTQQLTNGKIAPFIQTLPSRLLALRRAHGLTQKETGELIGVSSFAVCQWENGAIPNSPNRQRLQELFEGYEVQEGEAKAQPTAPAPPLQFVDPDATDEVILPRQDQLALRFKGKRLGSLVASHDLTIVLYLTVGGKVVWWVSPTAMHGDVQDFLRWVQDHSKASERVKKDIITYAASVGLQIFEDIA